MLIDVNKTLSFEVLVVLLVLLLHHQHTTDTFETVMPGKSRKAKTQGPAVPEAKVTLTSFPPYESQGAQIVEHHRAGIEKKLQEAQDTSITDGQSVPKRSD